MSRGARLCGTPIFTRKVPNELAIYHSVTCCCDVDVRHRRGLTNEQEARLSAMEKAEALVKRWAKDFGVELSDYALEELAWRVGVIAKADLCYTGSGSPPATRCEAI